MESSACTDHRGGFGCDRLRRTFYDGLNAAKASSMVSAGGGFHVEMGSKAFAQDSAYGASRPFATVVSNDDETAAAEAEEKILSKAVGK